MDIRQPISTNAGDLVARLGDLWKMQISALKSKYGEKITEIRTPSDFSTDVPIVYVQKESIVEILSYLKTEREFEYSFLSDLTATDEESDLRFEVVYNLYSQKMKARIRVKVRVAENDSVPTAVDVWPSANWAEREVFDMFGIHFKGHPDLRRILMDSRWQGHPLRKDYPIRGYQLFPTPEPIYPDLLEKNGVR